MAIVFISPRKRQKAFLLGIAGLFSFLTLMIALSVFLSRPKEIRPELVFNKPKINVNLELLDSEQFKNLELFSEMEMQFGYVATDAGGKKAEGKISAVSEEKAREVLEGLGLRVSQIKELEIGRENPFIPYYKITAPKPPKK